MLFVKHIHVRPLPHLALLPLLTPLTTSYSSIGALAEVLDASCLATQQDFATSQTALFNLWSADPASIQESIAALAREHLPGVLGQHYFVPNPKTGVGLSPKWDFTSAKLAGDADAFMIGAVNSSIPSPDAPASDVTWLHVVNVEGGLADTIFRFDTVGGQPPSSVRGLRDCVGALVR